MAKPEEAAPDAPELPLAVAYLWEWFLELLRGVSSNGWTVATPGWTDVDSWARLTGRSPEPWEAKALVWLGNARAAIEAARQAEETGNGGRHPR